MNNREMELQKVDHCADYFKKQPGFRRIFQAMRKKWESYGKVAGKISLSHATQQEKSALEGFLGEKQLGENICVTMKAFEKVLQETRFAPVSLEMLLCAYFGETLVSNREKQQKKARREQEFWERNKEALRAKKEDYEEAIQWIENMQASKSYGYVLLKSEYRKSEECADEYIRHAATCLRSCEDLTDGKELRLSILATQVTGNPHALDRQTVTGALFTHALCWRACCQLPQNAEEWKRLYESNGILVDDLSSQVIAYGVHLETVQGLHPAYEGFNREKEPCVITLANLSNVRKAYGEKQRVFIVENEMVFSELVKQVCIQQITVLCTSGQPRTAAYALLDLLNESGCEFYYAGDIDPEGICIAQRIWERYPGRVHIWRMNRDDYEKALSSEKVAGRRLELLKGVKQSELRDTADLLLKKGVAGYQEKLIEDMCKDMKEFDILWVTETRTSGARIKPE